MDRQLLWVWLSLLFGADKAIYKKVYENFEIETVYDFDDYDAAASGSIFTEYEIRNILDKNLKAAKETIEWCQKAGVEIITLDSEKYPKRLLALEKYPAALYCIGDLPYIDDLLCITIVGTRKQTTYGAKVSFELGYGLTKGGALVISGGALGNDASAQKGALHAGGKTVAVLGCGIDVVYPKENRELFAEIASSGAIITEYPPKTPPDAYNFPKRNRIMAALSNGTIVVEGGERSGTFITAEYAKLCGRTLFAVPGSIDTTKSSAPNELIRRGAIPVTSSTDVLEEYLEEYSEYINLSASKEKPSYGDDFEMLKEKETSNFITRLFGKSKSKKKAKKEEKETAQETKNLLDTSILTKEEKAVYDFMEEGKEYDFDVLSPLGLDIGTLSLCLLNLNIHGFVIEIAGSRYKKNI